MADNTHTTHNVEVKIEAKDLTSSVLGNIGKVAGDLGNKIDNITATVGGFISTFGGIGAVFGFGASVASAKQYLHTIDEISTITNESANNVAGMLHALEQTGVAGEESRAIMVSIARKQSEIAAGSQETAKLAKQYGVNLKKGPAEVLKQIADSVEKGKMGTGEVTRLLEEAGVKAMDLFRKGPAEVQRLINEGMRKNAHINGLTLEQYKNFDTILKKVKQAWTRITTIVGIKLLPKLTSLLETVEGKIDGWAEGAEKFGNFLAEHMDTAITMAKTFGKVMLANYALMKLTGQGMVGNAGKLGGLGKKLFGGGPKLGVSGKVMGFDILGKAAMGGKFAKGRAGLHTGAMAIFDKIPLVGKHLSKFMMGGLALGPIALLLLKVAAVAGAFVVIYKAFQRILKNADGIRDRLQKLLGEMWDNIKGIGAELQRIFSRDAPMGKFLDWVATGLLKVIEWQLRGMNKLLHLVRVFARMVGTILDDPKKALDPIKLWQQSVAEIAQSDSAKRLAKLKQASNIMEKLESAQGNLSAKQMDQFKQAERLMKDSRFGEFGGTTSVGGASRLEALRAKVLASTIAKMGPKDRVKIVQDFRGSRFDITQKFAEGFDPDRIAVAFAQDVGNLGERRLQSGLAPAFTVR